MILAQLLRTVGCGAVGSALFALMPPVAAHHLGLGAAGFGAMMGCIGMGAVAAGLFLDRVRAWCGLDRLVASACVCFALVMVVTAHVHVAAVVFPALILAGGAWMALMATFNTATQASAPPWVRSRAAALHALSALGSFATGSAVWGAASEIAGVPAALTVAALLMAGNVTLIRWFPLRMGTPTEVTPIAHWRDLLISNPPLPDDGPVAVEIHYQVRPGSAAAFLPAVRQLRASKRQDGAIFWQVYRDLSEPNRFVERFIVGSWADYLRQRARTTIADQETETRVLAHLEGGAIKALRHYIVAE